MMFKFFIQRYIMFLTRKEYDKIPNDFWRKWCVFCINDWEEKQYIVKETNFWNIRYAKSPYYWEKKHLMAIPKKHKIYTTELDKEELKDYKNVEHFMKEYYKDEKDYYSFIRQSLWWRSIEHLHYHYLPQHISFSWTNENPSFTIKNK